MKKSLFTFLAALCCAVGTNAQEIATWSGFRKGVATFTFDDGAPSHISDVAPLFDKYGYKASFFLVTNWNPNWAGFQELADNGHEIGSHSKSHPQNMTGEEASSKEIINEKILNHQCLTVAYPNCNVPNESAVRENYIAGRICNGSWSGVDDYINKDGPANWCKVSALMTGAEGNIKSTIDFTNAFQKVIQSNGWVMFLTHGLQGKNNGNATYSPTDINAIEGALKWASQNDKDIWITSFCNAAMYIKERKASAFTETARNAASISYSLVHSIADDVCAYQYPLSLRVMLPEGWTEIEVLQNGKSIESQIKDGFVYFEAVPNGGEIVMRDVNAAGIEAVPQHVTLRKQKIIQDGHLYLLHGNQTFNAQGARVE